MPFGVPESPRLAAGEALASTQYEEEPEAPAWWMETLTDGNVFALRPEDLFFVQLANSAVPLDENMTVALAGGPAPSEDPWQELMNLLAGLFNVLFGVL